MGMPMRGKDGKVKPVGAHLAEAMVSRFRPVDEEPEQSSAPSAAQVGQRATSYAALLRSRRPRGGAASSAPASGGLARRLLGGASAGPGMRDPMYRGVAK